MTYILPGITYVPVSYNDFHIHFGIDFINAAAILKLNRGLGGRSQHAALAYTFRVKFEVRAMERSLSRPAIQALL